jgi:hypothetical protein
MNKKPPVAPCIDPDRRRAVIEPFERLGQKLVTHLKFETFFACTQRMPHFNQVRQICESAYLREVAMQAMVRRQQDSCHRLEEIAGTDPALKAMIKRERSRYRKVDRSLDEGILTCWIHGGLWLFTNEDRMRIMHVCLRGRFLALDLPDAFRKRCKRLGVIGWNGFPSTYHDAPLRYNPGADPSAQVLIGQPWKDIFLPIMVPASAAL